VVQIDKLRKGFTKFASWLTGEQATGAALGAYLPMWFIEGDAVITETTLSNSGRGRLPVFSQSLKARLTEYGKDNFDKAYLGSYKDFVPDYYKMGYHLTAEIRQRYGTQIWSDVIENVGRNSWSLTPFRKALRKTGFSSPNKLYKSVYDSLAIQWQKHDETTPTSEYKSVALGNDDYTNIEYPQVTKDGHLFAQISGPGQRTRIVEIVPEASPKTVAYTGYRADEPIAANERWVAWSESKSHIRWPNAEYSVIRLYDRETKQTSTLNSTSRYFSPALAPESHTMAVVETTDAYQFFITLLNVKTGEIIQKIPTPDNTFPMHPSWTDVDDELILILLDDQGKKIITLNTEKQIWKTIRPACYDEPKYPVKTGNSVWFTASTQHAEEIFRMHLPSGITDRVTTSRFGATSPTLFPNHDKLGYSNYTPWGYQLVSTDPFQTEAENTTEINLTNPLVETLTSQEPQTVQASTNELPEIKPYSKWNLINLHSWAPAYVDIDHAAFYPGVTLMSQNLLGTAVARVGYNAAQSESREKFNAGFTYRGWFPIIDFDVKWGDFKEIFNDTDMITIEQQGKANEVKLETGIRTPLNLSSGKWNRWLQPHARLSWQNISTRYYEQTILTPNINGNLEGTGETNDLTSKGLNYWGMQYALYFHNKLRGTSRDVGTRWGQTISAVFRHTPWGNYHAGQAIGISTRIHFPGIVKHHAISVDNNWQTRRPGDEINSAMPYRTYQRFSNLIGLPRGYNAIYNDDLYVFRSTYQMPLWNPDLSLGGLAYIKRFRLNLFFDSARTMYELELIENNEKTRYSKNFSSTGIEILADFHALRFILPFSMGYRGGYRDADNTFFHEAIFSTSFNSFLVNKHK
jgi:hypothetical protein